MEMYRRLGVRPVINCATTYTRLGGSVMAPAVAQAMAEAAGCFLNLGELQEAAGQRLAELTRNEAAYVTNGAAAGLVLATAACITGDDIAAMARLPSDLSGLKNEVVIHRNQRNWYDFAIRQTGATLVEIGNAMETATWELDAAITERTAAVFYFAGSHLNRNTLSLPLVVERAHARGVPVVVDAAAQIPPAANLWRYTTELGADVAIFSGGKGLFGPQNSGLAVGRPDLIRAMALNGPPYQRIGRPMKVAKETIVGLVAAVELALERDDEALVAGWNATIARWQHVWSASAPLGVSVARDEINEAGEPIPRLIVRFGPNASLVRDDFIARLRAGEPRIEVVLHDEASVAFSVHLLLADQAEIVEERVADILTESAATAPRHEAEAVAVA
jgi:L-seryl-tRNA(Ser) seleniumtransferase